ncbi:MAG: glycoside hydrolase family 3 protein, partial [Alphaproteobacteria bacterium]|nr:glycoside hydrolase family 3 protein [Alphaproteobacteria bacterium]
FILFARHCDNPAQVKQLCHDLRQAVGRADAPILIDQEGGRVRRLTPPHWPDQPTMASFGVRYTSGDIDGAIAAVKALASQQAAMLQDLGITVNCAPLVDVPIDGADPIIGDRAFGQDPALVSRLGIAYAEALLAGGVTPIMKHLPGHGRANVDSHLDLPVIKASLAELEQSDFVPFRALANHFGDKIWAMTAHVVVNVVDATLPATLSPRVIQQIVRGHFGFDGLLLSDDVQMGALKGDYGTLSNQALQAGCDAVLLCNATLEQQRQTLEAVALTV